MKKILVLLAIMLPISSVIAEDDIVELSGFTEPTWADFAPANYVDVEEPKGIGKLNEHASYWFNRKVDFENSIQECRKMEENDIKFACYRELKVRQYQLNSDYNAKIEAQEQSRMQPIEMQNPINNMLPIGGYLNNFTKFQPNELQ